MALDTFATTPEYVELRRAVDERNWDAFAAALSRMTTSSATGALIGMGEYPSAFDFVEASRVDHGESPVLLTAWASCLTAQAWEIRTGGYAKTVSSDQFAGFFELLREADRVINQIVDEHPAYAPAWALALVIGRGLQEGVPDLQVRYAHLTELDSDNFPGQTQMLQGLLPKWGGSDAAAADFARLTAAAAPAGSNAPALIPIYHLEYWLDHRIRGQFRLSSEKVRDELRAAAAGSVFDPSHRLDPEGVMAHSAFAAAYVQGGHDADAAAHLRILDGRASEFPWYYLTDDENYEALVAEVLARASRKHG